MATSKSKALKMKKSEHTPKGRSQSYFRDSKGILESSGSAWPKPRKAKTPYGEGDHEYR